MATANEAESSKPDAAASSFSVTMAEPAASADVMSQKREEVMAERNKKLQQRMAAMAQRRMKRSGGGRGAASKQQKETLQKFISDFTAQFDAIEESINKQETYAQFKQLKLTAFKLESYLADNAAILPAYTYEAKNRMMATLKSKINARQKEVAPKAKFGFSRKLAAAPISPLKKSDATESAKKETESANDEESKEILLSEDLLKADEIRISDKSLSTIYLGPGEIGGADVCLSNLVNCTVSLCDHIGALRVDNLKHCTVMTGPISSSMLCEHMTQSTVVSQMRQCRLHHIKDSKFYLHVNSEPVIEHSNGVQVAPYNLRYPELKAHQKASQVDMAVNRWSDVKDFNWFKQKQSPHWSVIPEAAREKDCRPVIPGGDGDDSDDEEL